MDARFVDLLIENTPDARLIDAEPGRPLRVAIGVHEATILEGHVTTVAIDVPGLDGFGLVVTRGDKWLDLDVGDDRFDDAYAVVTNDDAMAVVWLDAASRDALRSATYVDTVRGWWNAALADDRLVLAAAADLDGANAAIGLRAAIVLADRGRRWRDAFRTAAADEPAPAEARFALDRPLARIAGPHPFEITASRNAFGSLEPALAIVATATLAGTGDVVLARRDLPEPWWDDLLRSAITDDPQERPSFARAALPRDHALVVGAGGDPDRLAALASDPAFDTCPPTAVRLRPGAIDLVWTGSELLDEARLVDTARALMARADGGPGGPYR